MINKLTLLNSKSASARCDWVVRDTLTLTLTLTPWVVRYTLTLTLTPWVVRDTPTLTLTPWVVREKDMRHSDPSH